MRVDPACCRAAGGRGRHRHVAPSRQAQLPRCSPLREWLDAAVKRKAIENEPNGDPNDSAPDRMKTAKPLFVL
ncbi:hypothetical protein [Burkholderia pyrrocinia]|uniref:hypothetical protein n=1 Tax=Burkholderia pyrrocinia TaxID=60550 RepID=UPI000A8AA521|nr:hypothetical protein [Burkholderia pyrrocinia]